MHRLLRLLLRTVRKPLSVLLLVSAMVWQSMAPSLAGTTGVISGTAVDSKTGRAVAGVTVNAVSPSASYTAKTDSRGFFSFTGVSPDTYTVSFQATGFQPVSSTGVSVFADQVATANVTLQSALKTIGSVSVRSAGGAYQPTQTQDTYTVTASQINTVQGKANSTDEKALLSRLPGASLDSNGYPVLRGGRENEEGYQNEGIDQTEAFGSLFVNSLTLDPSVAQLQLTPGPGDASSGNSGTGVINLVAKRGTYPPFGTISVETLAHPYGRQLSFEYGFATPNGHFSNYFSYLGYRDATQYGQRGSSAVDLSTPTFYSSSFITANDIVDNLYYKFGKHNSQSLQFFFQNQQVNSLGTYGGGSSVPYATADPFTADNVAALTGLNRAQFQSLTELSLGQSSVNELLGSRGGYSTYAPNSTIKVQYSNNLNASTFLTLKAYNVNGVQTIDAPYNQVLGPVAGLDHRALEGGIRDGVALDMTKQFGTKHLVQVGTKYEFAHPVFDYDDPLDALYVFAGALGDGAGELYDFINPRNSNPTLAHCPIDPPSVMNPAQSYCGYLTRYLGANPGTVPRLNQSTRDNRQDYAAYVTDTISSSDKLKITAGLRLDGSHFQIPSTAGCNSAVLDTCLYLPTGYVNGVPYTTVSNDAKNPLIVEPRLAVSLQLSRYDALRASYGRTVEFSPLTNVDAAANPSFYSRFAGIPSYDVFGAIAAGLPPGAPRAARSCGVTADRLCTSYADQLYWEDQRLFGVPTQPVKPETFNNFDFSYSHQFANNIGLRVTPFYRRGYDAISLASPVLINPATGQPIVNPANGTPVFGAPVSTNLGIDRTTGVEFQLTKEAAYGLSGQISATYINEFSNVVPTSQSEDLAPNIPPASLALGNQYRVGFISPFVASAALSYRTHFGLRVNPIVTYNRGYPIGAGNLVATAINGQFVNVVNTNVTAGASVNGIAGSPNYVDPGNPGTLFSPNIIATRGTPEKSSPGGNLSAPVFNTDLSIEYHPERSRSTFGVLLTNLFNQLANNRAYVLNDRYQPVATGVSGPLTGLSQFPILYPGLGIGQYSAAQFGSDPYRIYSNNQPFTMRFYYQLAL